MQSFKVQRSGDNLRYKTKCSGSVPFSYTATYKTSCTPMEDYELEYLDRQNVACGGNQVLQSFKVIQSGCSGYDRRYEYQCGNVQWVTTRTKQSSCSTMYGKYLEYLDRQTVDCGGRPQVQLAHRPSRPIPAYGMSHGPMACGLWP